MNESAHIRQETGHLFGGLWTPFDDGVVKSGQISKDAAERIAIGQDSHRVLGVKA